MHGDWVGALWGLVHRIEVLTGHVSVRGRQAALDALSGSSTVAAPMETAMGGLGSKGRGKDAVPGIDTAASKTTYVSPSSGALEDEEVQGQGEGEGDGMQPREGVTNEEDGDGTVTVAVAVDENTPSGAAGSAVGDLGTNRSASSSCRTLRGSNTDSGSNSDSELRARDLGDAGPWGTDELERARIESGALQCGAHPEPQNIPGKGEDLVDLSADADANANAIADADTDAGVEPDFSLLRPVAPTLAALSLACSPAPLGVVHWGNVARVHGAPVGVTSGLLAADAELEPGTDRGMGGGELELSVEGLHQLLRLSLSQSLGGQDWHAGGLLREVGRGVTSAGRVRGSRTAGPGLQLAMSRGVTSAADMPGLMSLHELVLSCGGLQEAAGWASAVEDLGPEAWARGLAFAGEWTRLASESDEYSEFVDPVSGGGGIEEEDMFGGTWGHSNQGDINGPQDDALQFNGPASIVVSRDWAADCSYVDMAVHRWIWKSVIGSEGARIPSFRQESEDED